MPINKKTNKYIIFGFIILILLTIVIWSRKQHEGWSDVPMQFPPMLVINLPERKDRREHILKEFNTWPQKPECIEAVRRKPGWKGCTLSHLKCIEIAKQRKYPWVLCIEDDCQLNQDALKRFNSILPYLWDTRDKWDIYSGGISTLKRIGNIISKEHNIIAVNGYATHFILIHEGTYDKVLKDISKEDDRLQKIDVYYNDNLRTWTSIPYIGVQRVDFSDIEGRHADYDSIFKHSENKLMNILGLAISD